METKVLLHFKCMNLLIFFIVWTNMIKNSATDCIHHELKFDIEKLMNNNKLTLKG